jgi:plasmid stability protein
MKLHEFFDHRGSISLMPDHMRLCYHFASIAFGQQGDRCMAQVLIRDLDESVVAALKQRAATNGRSLQAELKAILEEQAHVVQKAEARALATRIRQRIASRLQTDSGELQSEDRHR